MQIHSQSQDFRICYPLSNEAEWMYLLRVQSDKYLTNNRVKKNGECNKQYWGHDGISHNIQWVNRPASYISDGRITEL